jgi:hypothetical protein
MNSDYAALDLHEINKWHVSLLGANSTYFYISLTSLRPQKY